MSATDQALVLARMMRDSLAIAGLTRHEHGGSVYWAGGTGDETLVLLHGTNDHAGTWARVVPMLVQRYRLILPDLAGHGESEPKTGPIPIALVVERVHEIVVREGANRFALAGNSFGAWVAVLYALAHPERVTRLVLESGGGLARPLGVPLVAKDRETAMTILRAVWGPNYVAQDWVIETLIARSSESPMLRLDGIMEHFVDARLPEIKAPATLVWGADDGVVPLSYAEAMKSALKGSTLHIIDGAAHVPHLQQPERFVQCLTATS